MKPGSAALLLEQDTEPLHMFETIAFRVRCKVAQALGHTLQAQLT